MYRPVLICAVLGITLCCAGHLYAQSPDVKYEVGVNAGTFIYQGDLTPSAFGSYRTARFGMGVWGSKRLSNSFSVRANLAVGSLEGSDAAYSTPSWRQERSLYFTSSVKELSVQGMWDVSGGRFALAPYVFTGIGLAAVNVKRDYSQFNAVYFANDKAATDGLAVDISRTPPKALLVVPVGAGLRYPVSSSLSLHAETSYRLTTTDYLDGFSQVANPKLKDHYQTFSVGIIYSLGARDPYDCPRVRP